MDMHNDVGALGRFLTANIGSMWMVWSFDPGPFVIQLLEHSRLTRMYSTGILGAEAKHLHSTKKTRSSACATCFRPNFNVAAGSTSLHSDDKRQTRPHLHRII
jgi:hypothetical protein